MAVKRRGRYPAPNTGDAVNLYCFQRFLEVNSGGSMVGMRLASMGLARTGRADHGDVVASRQAISMARLAVCCPRIFEVDEELLRFAQSESPFDLTGTMPLPEFTK
jgi:hypothetical protein